MTQPRPPAHTSRSSVNKNVEPLSGPTPAGTQGGTAPEAALTPAETAPSPDSRPVWTREELERVRARDPEALARFFEAYFDRVFGLVHRLLGERTIAEDITQDVFLKAHRALHRLDPERDPSPWLTAIAYNACRDLWRSGAHRMKVRSTSIEGNPGIHARLAGGAGDPERDLIEAEREAQVRRAIERLPEQLRTAVLLYDYQGMSHQEIANLMGIHHAAARKRYSRALATLGRLLRESMA